jgi:hypothetical protein
VVVETVMVVESVSVLEVVVETIINQSQRHSGLLRLNGAKPLIRGASYVTIDAIAYSFSAYFLDLAASLTDPEYTYQSGSLK